MSIYVTGAAAPNATAYARFETKPTSTYRDGRVDSGGGYERWRSCEYRPHTAGDAKEDVYVAVHRLLAVVACYPTDMPLAEITEHMVDRDVHHRSGVEWDNRPDNLAVREHGRHSSITQAQIRAWAEDDKRKRERVREGRTDEDCCDGCGEPADVLATSPGFSGQRCLDCSMEAADGEPIEL